MAAPDVASAPSVELDNASPAKRRRTRGPTRRRVGGKNFIDLKAQDGEENSVGSELELELPIKKLQSKRKRLPMTKGSKIEENAHAVEDSGGKKVMDGAGKLKKAVPRNMGSEKATKVGKGVAVGDCGEKANMKATMEMEQVSEQKVISKKPRKRGKEEEKRLRRWRSKPPQSYDQRLQRATSQRMFVIDRTRKTSPEGVPSETIELAGSTGNIYTITIAQQPHCTCPDNDKGNQCKHIVYVMHLVLKAPPELEYQLAFVTSELKEIFERAPLPSAEAQAKAEDEEGGKKKDEKGRKSMDGADCPICFMPFEPETEDIVWCRAACGNNVHRNCFEQWAEAQNGREVRCVYCRTQWQGDEDSMQRIKAVKAKGKTNAEGYVNVGAALGMSSVRDTSTYHQFRVQQQRRSGETFETC